jgi:hypothetical protein
MSMDGTGLGTALSLIRFIIWRIAVASLEVHQELDRRDKMVVIFLAKAIWRFTACARSRLKSGIADEVNLNVLGLKLIKSIIILGGNVLSPNGM